MKKKAREMENTAEAAAPPAAPAPAPADAPADAAVEAAGTNGADRPEQAATEAEVAALRAELEAARDKMLRQAAEFQNYRRRTEQEKAGLVELGKSVVVEHLLDVVDDFGRSLEAAAQVEEQGRPEAAYEAFKQGVDLVYRKFMDELARLGVRPIEAVGQPFNEHEHEALMQQPAPEGTPPGIVLQEFQRGYRMGDRVLRHSKVVVSA